MTQAPLANPEKRFFHDRPIIGVLNQPWTDSDAFTGNHVQATFIRFCEMGGAVPILFDIMNMTEDEIREFMSEINGVIIPGGCLKLQNPDKSCTDICLKYKIVYDEAIAINESGTYFPVWAICMGLQMIAAWEAPETMEYGYFDDLNRPQPTFIQGDYKKYKLTSHLTEEQVKGLATNNWTFESHTDGIPVEAFHNSELPTNYNLVSTSTCRKGLDFVACIEHKKYPIYAFQFHPEKQQSTRTPMVNAPLPPEVRELNQKWANFLADECKYNERYMPWEKVSTLMFCNFSFKMTPAKHQDCYFM